LENMQRL